MAETNIANRKKKRTQIDLMDKQIVGIVGELEELFAKQAKALSIWAKRHRLTRRDQGAYEKRKRRIESLRSELRSLATKVVN